MSNVFKFIAAAQKAPGNEIDSQNLVIEMKIDQVLDSKAPQEDVICVVGTHALKRTTLRCLEPMEWLNCETIDAYMHLLQVRADSTGVPIEFLPTHFYTMITNPEYNFNNGLMYFHNKHPFECDTVVIPMHQGKEGNQHWVMVVVNMKSKQVEFYDPLLQLNTKKTELRNVKRWFHDLAVIRSVKSVNVPLWIDVEMKTIPKQQDDYNCGVYVLLYAECLGRGESVEKLEIDPHMMTKTRRKFVMDLCLKQIA